MMAVLMSVQVFVCIALIGVVLIQRSEGGGLGIGTSQGMGAFMSGRGTANLLTRTTAILAAIFLALSLTMAVLNRGTSGVGSSVLAMPQTSPPAPPGKNVPLNHAAVPPGQNTKAAPGPTPAPAAPPGPQVPH
jgi:preprotein translocase subunit SecG